MERQKDLVVNIETLIKHIEERGEKSNMKRKFSIKRVIACALAIMTAFTAIPLESVYASEVTAVVSDDGTTLTISGTGEVPAMNTLVSDTTSITKVVVEEGISFIGSFAFENCTAIKEIQLPNSLMSIGAYAFSGCTSLETINIPNGIETINMYSFRNCTSLANIELPSSVKTISQSAFINCTSLTTVIIPESVTSIEENAFSGCSSLITVNLPNNLTEIKSYTFYNCSALTGIILPENLVSIKSNAFNNCKSLTEITIPNTVVEIDKAFRFSGLQTITFEDGITVIPATSCAEAESLINANIPNSVIEIGEEAFDYCSSLTIINIPDSLTTIGARAFNNCSSLTTIILPEGVTVINDLVFNNCSSLTTIQLSNNTVSIGEDVFNSCTSLTAIELPQSLTSIGKNGFYNCTSLKEIVIPDNVTTLKEQVFCQCESLIKVTLPNTLTTIEDGAFYFCRSLPNIIIPDNVTEIGESVFYSCMSLTDITIPEGITEIKANTFNFCNSLTSVNLPNSLTTIRENAFAYCDELIEIVIPDNVATIESGSFYTSYWPALSTVLVSNNLDLYNIDWVVEHNRSIKSTVTFMNGSEIHAEEVVYNGQTVNEPTEPVGETEFLGWVDGYENDYDFSTVIKHSITLNAKYKPNEHTVTFKVDNSVYESQTVENEQNAVRPTTDPSKENGRFIGWYTDETYTTEFDFNTAITADTEVYAYFINQYTVTFMSSGEVVKTQSVEDGEYITEPEALEDKDMYSYNCRFVKWNYDFSQPVTSDLTIYAEWEVYCNVTVYNGIDDSLYVVEAPLNGVVDVNDIPVTPAPRAGYEFVGYYRNFNQSVLFDFNEPIDSHTNITEVWKKNDIPAEVVNHYIHDEETDFNWGGNLTVDNWLSYLGSECYSEIINEKYTFDSNYNRDWKTTYLFEKDVLEENLYSYMVLTKYDVDGNAISRELISTYQEDVYGNGLLQIEIDFGEFGGRLDIYRATDTKTVQFAGYDVIYTNHDKENCNLANCNCAYNNVNVSNLNGYGAATGYDEFNGYKFTPCQHHTDFSHLDVLNYVEYKVIDGLPVYVNKTTGRWESASSMPGYGKLIGWKTSKDATEMIDWNTVVFTDNTVLYPVIENYNLVKVTFVDSVTNEILSEQYVSPYYGDVLTEPQRPTVPDGFIFIGWSATKSVDDLFRLSNNPATDITLYSVYQKSYLVEFLVEKEDGSLEQWNYQWVDENETAGEPWVPIKEGYDFLGWFNGDIKFDFNTQVTSGLSLIGKYAVQSFKVYFYDYDGNLIGDKDVEYGQTVEPIEAPVKEGYEFIGWFNYNYSDEEAYDFSLPTKQGMILYGGYREKHVHNYNTTVEFKESTCIEKGYEVFRCTCGEENRTDFELDFTNHVGETEIKGQKEATCTKNGYTGDTYCKSCDRVVKAGKEITATGHDTKTVGQKDATCTAEGYTGDKVCKTCDSVVVEGTKIDKTAHVGGDAVKENYIEPTTESKGSYDLVVYCENCETEILRKTEEVPMLEPEDTEDEEESTEPEVESEETEDTEEPESEELESEETEETEEEPETEEPGDPVTDDDPLYVEDTDEDTMSDIFGNFVEAVKTMAIVFSISLAAVTGVLGLLLLVLAWMKKVKVFNNTNTDMYSEDNYEVVLKTSVKTEGNKIAELFRKEDRVWTVIISEETLNNRVSDSFKVELNKFFCKRYNGEQLIIRLGSDDNSRQIGFVIDEAENVVTFTYED